MYFQNRPSAPSVLQPAGLERGRREQEHGPAHGVRGRQPGDREAAPRGGRGPGRPEQVGEDAGSDGGSASCKGRSGTHGGSLINQSTSFAFSYFERV